MRPLFWAITGFIGALFVVGCAKDEVREIPIESANVSFAPVLEQALLAHCSACHGNIDPGIPSLDGLTSQEIKDALIDYKTDETGGSVMHRLARGYSDEEMARMALILGTDQGS